MSGVPLVCSLAGLHHGKAITITYRDSSKGFADLPDLAGAVRKSIEQEGLDRGLPLALSFGFYFPLESLEVKLGRSWQQLYPADVPQEQDDVVGFGVRWRFPLGDGPIF